MSAPSFLFISYALTIPRYCCALTHAGVYLSHMSKEVPDAEAEKGPEMIQKEAAEMLQTDALLADEERARLLEMVIDPFLSYDVLGYDNTHQQKLTRPQAEKLLE